MRLQLFHHAARSFSTLRAQPSAILALNTLADNAGARQKAKRVGRGIGSGRGKTGGKGHKGQGQRSGKPFVGFEGGQTPLHKRAPKRGFNVRDPSPMDNLDLGKLQEWIRAGRVVPNQSGVITLKEISDSNIVGRIKHGVKLLASPRVPLTDPIMIHVSRASKSAIAAVEAAGGRVMTVYNNRLALRALLKPHKFGAVLPRSARPKPKIAPYYLSFENRGYLSPEMQLLTSAPHALPESLRNATPEQVHEALYASRDE